MTFRSDARQDFLGLDVHALTIEEFCRGMVAASSARDRTTLVGYVNAATVDLAASSRDFYDQLRRFDCIVADGQSVVWASRHLKAPLPERVNVTDVVERVLSQAAEAGVTVGLVGGPPGEAQAFAERMAHLDPAPEFVVVESGYLDAEGEEAVRARIAAANPGLVLLGMGAPLQEERALRWSRDSDPRLWWCVGAVFEYFVGRRKRAPVWVRRAGLEWVVRFAQEPRRLARRYLLGNPRFLWRVARRRALWPHEPRSGRSPSAGS